jgi:1,4-dihydroxy-2-naphthoate polyprenyltransferase
MNIGDWISAARLRTLPLALASIGMGAFLSAHHQRFSLRIFLLACLTTVLLQILSNFANDLGDTQNGADLANRIGPSRAVQSGKISQKAMKFGIVVMVFASLLAGILLLYFAFDGFASSSFWILLGIGLVCILAAYTYTAGKKPYGYAGLGDLSVFLFFGLVGVLGSTFLYTQAIYQKDIWPAIACGALATGVLNLNNIRDIESDKKAKKNTIPVRLGRKKAEIYHWSLLLIAVICTLISFFVFQFSKLYFLVAIPLILKNGFELRKTANPDPLLKKLALISLAFVILFGLSF